MPQGLWKTLLHRLWKMAQSGKSFEQKGLRTVFHIRFFLLTYVGG